MSTRVLQMEMGIPYVTCCMPVGQTNRIGLLSGCLCRCGTRTLHSHCASPESNLGLVESLSLARPCLGLPTQAHSRLKVIISHGMSVLPTVKPGPRRQRGPSEGEGGPRQAGNRQQKQHQKTRHQHRWVKVLSP